MPVSIRKFVQQRLEHSEEWLEVSTLADRLCDHLNTPEASARIAEANQPRHSSSAVQATFGDFARELGFENEKVGLFADEELALRPDYFRRVDDTGVLLEVERGKTTINNTDLLDFLEVSRMRARAILVPAGSGSTSPESNHVSKEALER